MIARQSVVVNQYAAGKGKRTLPPDRTRLQPRSLTSTWLIEREKTQNDDSNAVSGTREKVWKELATWIDNAGGYIDDRLQLLDDTPSGCRGVIATSRITEADLAAAPLIVVPGRLYMTTEQADDLLLSITAARKGANGNQPHSKQQLSKLAAAARLGMLLAHERRMKGPSSFWWPYIASLPENPPNAWLMSQLDLENHLESYFGSATSTGPHHEASRKWLKAVQQARTAMEMLSARCNRDFGSQLGIDEADILWGLGQVLSRSFGSQDCLGLAPCIDLLNHQQGAAKPQGFEPDMEGIDPGNGEETPGPCFYVTSSRCGQPLGLEAGDELCISYIGSSRRAGAALNAFLNFGFVPPELRGPALLQ